MAHKTGAAGIALGLRSLTDVQAALPTLAAGDLWIEEMVEDPIVELLIGVTRDAAHGFVLTLAAGGVMTEVLADRQCLLIPARRADMEAALRALHIAPILDGYRGGAPVDMTALLNTIEAVQAYVLANAAQLEEVEINPLLCTKTHTVAVDALIRIGATP